jgi:hypothetical protein
VTSPLRLVEIHVYPVKGAAGIALERADVLAGGLRHDRRFMLVDQEGVFITQRAHPRLALVTTALGSSSLVLGTPSGGTVEVAIGPELGAPGRPRRVVRCWDDDVEAVEIEGPASELLSEHLGKPCTLVFMPDDVVRAVEEPYGAPGDRVGFADGYPVLLATRASLAELNARLAAPVPMNRFRPNVVVEGGAAYEEDQHTGVRIGSTTFRMPKRCARCQVTTVDQATGLAGKEPLRTLAAYRTENNKVYFAQNLIPDQATGAIAVGDEVAYFGLVAT